jgi:Tol biopolymer transport system component
MKTNKAKEQIYRKVSIILLLLMLFIALINISCSDYFSIDESYGIVSPRLSNDNRNIIFGYCHGKENKCELVTYEIATQKIYRFNPTGNKIHGSPVFSPDSQKIAFASNKYDYDNESNIYSANADGRNARQLTNTKITEKISNSKDVDLRFDVMPSFSPDGNRVIFMRATVRHERAFPMRGKMLSHWDVYEIDIKTGVERRLTDYAFYAMSKPSYLPDGKRFIFSAAGPKNVPGQALFKADEYKKRYKDNHIFIMDGEKNILQPAIINGWYSSDPSVSQDGTILFSSVTNEMDGLPKEPYNYDLFIYKKGKIKRITKLEAHMAESFISFDGFYAIFLADVNKPRNMWVTLWILNTDGSGLRKIELPWDQIRKAKVHTFN